VIAKKVIKAPFDGKLGVSQVNPGQFLNAGDAVVTLQQLDPIYVDFFLPQQELAKIQIGQNLSLKIDTYPDLTFVGKITTINPLVDPDTRNVQVEATISNPLDKLLPGMFGQVSLDIDKPEAFLTLPQTAISYNPYGDMVYIITQSNKKDKKGKPILTAQQTFVKLGNTRGDQIAILSGVKEGDVVVTSGQLKLKNGSPVTINNTVLQANNPHPSVENNQ
jgi:membrane fusion protein (multidrug efflux system)